MMRVGVEIRQSTLRRTEVSFARVHVLVGIVANGEDTRLPPEARTAPETRSGAIRGRLDSRQNLLHGVSVEPLSDPRCLDSGENV